MKAACSAVVVDYNAVTVFTAADMHMMVSRPEQWVKPMAAAGANQYTFHIEATTNPGNLIKEIRESGMKVRKWHHDPKEGQSLSEFLFCECIIVKKLQIHIDYACLDESLVEKKHICIFVPQDVDNICIYVMFML